jgi:hypothetical protein
MARFPLVLTFLAAAVAPLAALGSGSPSRPAPTPGKADDDEPLPVGAVTLAEDEAVVPMESWGGRPVVRIRINGEGPYPFILDTGASGSLLLDSLARRLGLPVTREVDVMSPGSSAPLKTSVVTIGEIRLGAATLRGSAMAAMDLEGMLGGPGAPVGVLSAAGFPGHLVTLDYPGRLVRLRAGSLPPADGRSVFAYEALDGLPSLPTVPVRLGDVDVVAHLDTGAPFALLLPESYLDRVPLGGAAAEIESSATVDQTFRVLAGTLEGSLHLGDYRWESPVIHFGGLPRANVGARILSEFEVTLDATNQRIRLTRP